MKKAIAIIALTLLCSVVMGQNYDTQGKLIVNKKVTQDTAVVLATPTNLAWGFVIKWTGGTSDSSTVVVKSSKDYGVTYQTYPGLDPVTITGATGNLSFEDDATVSHYLQVYFDITPGEVGYFTIEYILSRNH